MPQSVTGSAATTASAPAASAVRSMAPRLPGFSTAWQSTVSACGPTASSTQVRTTEGTTAMKPSGPSRYAARSNAVRDTWTVSTPSRRAWSTTRVWLAASSISSGQ